VILVMLRVGFGGGRGVVSGFGGIERDKAHVVDGLPSSSWSLRGTRYQRRKPRCGCEALALDDSDAWKAVGIPTYQYHIH
jgi:hypothetical protein